MKEHQDWVSMPCKHLSVKAFEQHFQPEIPPSYAAGSLIESQLFLMSYISFFQPKQLANSTRNIFRGKTINFFISHVMSLALLSMQNSDYYDRANVTLLQLPGNTAVEQQTKPAPLHLSYHQTQRLPRLL